MTDPLVKTFELLAASPSAHAAEVLQAGLEVNDPAIRGKSAEALLGRPGTRGHVEVIRHWSELDDAVRAALDRRARQIEPALKYAIEHGDECLRRHAHEIARRTDAFELHPVLLRLLDAEDPQVAEDAAETFRQLTNRLHEQLARQGNDNPRTSRSPAYVRNQFLTALDQAATRFADRRRPESIVEAVLVLGEPEHFAVKKVLWQGAPECRELAGRILLTSRHPGVMRIILASFARNYPHVRAFEALSRRDDPEFICFLLRSFPTRLSKVQHKNFAQVDSVAWLGGFGQGLESIPPGLQPALIRFVAAVGIPLETKLAVQEWLLRNGGPEGRLAVADSLGRLDDSAVQQIVLDGLTCGDPSVQAWATGQLRSYGGGEAFTLLIERLDSPVEEVRVAARDELHSFDLDVMLDLHQQLEPAVCRRAGELLLKIDPELLERVRAELVGPLRRRRILVARAMHRMGLQDRIVEALGWMLDDEDAHVRRVAAEILATVASAEADALLRRAAEDPSPRVRQAIGKALEQRQRSEIFPGPRVEEEDR
ncbi:MAG: HEAT repeat domain-containing protein [Planctomycetaceae bacterium]